MKLTANYHTHTKRCGHAKGEDRDYVEAAVRAGIQVLGFSDHVPLPPGSIASDPGIRMSPELLGDYFDSLLALREEYAGRIELHIGFEAEYLPSCFARLQEMLSEWPCEYLILGQHFLEDGANGIYMGMPFDDARILERHVDSVIDAIDTGAFCCIAHPDIANFKGDEKVYFSQARRLCRAAKEAGLPLEVNVLGMQELRWYPRGLFFEAAAEEGCALVIGVDAHDPRRFLSAEAREAERDCREFAASFDLPLLERIRIWR